MHDRRDLPLLSSEPIERREYECPECGAPITIFCRHADEVCGTAHGEQQVQAWWYRPEEQSFAEQMVSFACILDSYLPGVHAAAERGQVQYEPWGPRFDPPLVH